MKIKASKLSLRAVSRYREAVLSKLDEPRTPNELAEMIGVHQITAQTALMELAVEGKIKHKKIGRFHLFWKPCEPTR